MPLKTIFIITTSILLLFGACFAQEDFPFLGELCADNINIRTDSTISSQVICAVNKNSQLDVVAELYDWYKVLLPKHASAYIKKNLLECVDYVSTQTQNSYRSAKVLKEIVNIRLGASESEPIIGKAKKDDVIYIKAEKDDWYEIEPTLNCFGWINKKFVKKIPSSQKIQSQKEPANTAAKETHDTLILTIEGVILPKTFKRVATHKLIDKDKKLYLLKSSEVSLNSFNYQKVKITGELSEGQEKKSLNPPIINVKKVEVTD